MCLMILMGSLYGETENVCDKMCSTHSSNIHTQALKICKKNVYSYLLEDNVQNEIGSMKKEG